MKARLREKGWLKRVLDVELDNGVFVVEYSGVGVGYEAVWVNGREVARPTSWLWFVPRIEFALGMLPAAVEVRVWPWLMIRSFRLIVDGIVVFADDAPVESEPLPPDNAAPLPTSPAEETGILVPGRFSRRPERPS
jgi:hypothetical protein